MARAKTVVRRLWPIAMLALAQITTPAAASHVDQYKVAGGMAVYLGVLPPEIVRGHAPEHPEGTVHGGATRGRKYSHVVIALFDTNAGKRTPDADVYARVAGRDCGSGRTVSLLSRGAFSMTDMTANRKFLEK